ncbi:hypothetical protein HUA74_33460 [Myxococcus sp. CA051A]|uniref:hypothetical protein n=1 Tax=unclassified Myxococcus TaxID=2648731 RepID=UPI00157B9D6B|nr:MULTISPECIES: hypothetical protein [unclassified Myxococcus]NTX08556.1 hypothetical protein [Myxococcus sp. CA040A]NTX11988.1 hypothetical protein [Myxococcus sp. CA056]NTX39261.1 hypothetical protein [Myxococcus sp. CA033]NTX57265.1 hypothetical protein [Myxococcus sp. CA039A]NTX65578.1 hypothetical protein [Myxococcus sp. CA051A]
MPYKFLKQPKTPPDSKLCGFYALYHFTNGGLTRDEFIQKATQHYETALGLPNKEAQEMVMDGNDPSVLGLYGLAQSDADTLKKRGVGVIADTTRGHFFTVRQENGVWSSYDSYNHDAAKAYPSFEALQKAEIGNSQIWV